MDIALGRTEERDRACRFCGIVKGQVESRIVFRDAHSIAFLDSRPLFPGHCLLIPVQHYETLADLPRSLVGPLFVNARLVAAAVQRGMSSDGSFVAINNHVSQSVPHLHIHIVPRKEKDGLRGFFWPRQKYASTQEMLDIQNAIQTAVAQLLKSNF